jgi:hypothetical protein
METTKHNVHRQVEAQSQERRFIDIPCQWPSSLCDKLDGLQLTIRAVQIAVLLIKIRVALGSTEAFSFVRGETLPGATEEVCGGGGGLN